MPGDEPPVANKNYFSKTTTEQSHAGPIPDPLSQFREREQFGDSRQSTPYSVHGGEKTNPFDGIPISRAKSTRESSRQAGSEFAEETASPTSKPRSSSVPRRPNKEEVPPSMSVPDNGNRPRTAGETAGAASNASKGQASEPLNNETRKP
jgi:hypothetical protein